MRSSIAGRDVISLKDFSRDEILLMIDISEELKTRYKAGELPSLLSGTTLAMIFERPSTRTRIAFETVMTQLGGHAQFLTPQDLQLARGESWRDTARILSRYVDGIVLRWNKEVTDELARHASIPVINGSDGYTHPTQGIAELMTIKEKKGQLKGANVTFAWGFCSEYVGTKYSGKPPTYINDLLWAGAKLGMNMTFACPEGYEPSAVIEEARPDAKRTGSKIAVVHNLREGVRDADVVISKNWVPEPSKKYPHNTNPGPYKKWILNEDVVSSSREDVIVMHALPAFKGEELTEEVFEGPHSVIFDEAENGLHSKRGILALLFAR